MSSVLAQYWNRNENAASTDSSCHFAEFHLEAQILLNLPKEMHRYVE